jgi:hypothetical protein
MSDHSMFRKFCSNLVFFMMFSTLISGCSDSIDKKNNIESPSTHETDIPTQAEQSISTLTKETSTKTAFFIDIVDEHFSELIKKSQKLHETLINFTKKPSNEGLQTTIKALEDSHSLFVSGYFLDTCCIIYSQYPTKDGNNLSSIALKTRLDQQPLLPGYLDVVDGYPFSGLIYSDIPITRENMEQEFQLGDPAYVTLGFHALELILKGSNQNRKVSDFSTLTSTNDTSTAPAGLRRTLYTILLASEIEKDILILKLAWEENLRKQLLQNTVTQENSFFLMLNLKVQEELQSMGSEQANPKNNNTQLNGHFNLESLALKQTLLEKFASLEHLETEP